MQLTFRHIHHKQAFVIAVTPIPKRLPLGIEHDEAPERNPFKKSATPD
jgi:hypothetical protein